MNDRASLDRAVRRVLWTLRAYLDDLIVIGGWVPHLYRRYGGFAEWRSELSGTAEVDVLLAETIAARDRQPLAELLARHGMRADPNGAGAVWEGEQSGGEKIEFFVPHTGLATDVGKPRGVPGQSGLGAISLDHMQPLLAHTRRLHVPIAIEGGPPSELVVRVPSLGAYLVAKASTFMKRPPGIGTRSRRAKDLVYVRDVMAAGTEVARGVEHDVAEMRANVETRRHIAYAVTQLALLGANHVALRDAAEELAERDAMAIDAARQEVLGYVTDLREVLAP